MKDLHKACLICNSTPLIPLKGYQKAFLHQCESCGFVFSRAVPTEKELVEHYKGYGRDDYLSPITVKRYHQLLDEFERYRKTNKLIDVGCGIGYFLDEAKKRGWEVYGTEYTDEAITICENKGVVMHRGVLDPKNYDIEFDVITSFEVVEHINNPQEEVMNFRKLLRKGGLFYCTTPNFNSLSRRILKDKWNTICYPEHLSYYTISSLSKLLKNNTIVPYKRKTTGISINIYKKSMGDKNQQVIAESSDDENLRRKMDKNKVFGILKWTLNTVLTIFRLGDTIKIYAVKK